MSEDILTDFLAEYPLKTRWLDDIIEVLVRRPRCTAHVSDIAQELWRKHNVETPQEVITRTINDFCSDAQDWKRNPEYDLFAWVEPATYRLRSCPNQPDTLELVRIEFESARVTRLWQVFNEKARLNHNVKWLNLTNRKKLVAFATAYRKMTRKGA